MTKFPDFSKKFPDFSKFPDLFPECGNPVIGYSFPRLLGNYFKIYDDLGTICDVRTLDVMSDIRCDIFRTRWS